MSNAGICPMRALRVKAARIEGVVLAGKVMLNNMPAETVDLRGISRSHLPRI